MYIEKWNNLRLGLDWVLGVIGVISLVAVILLVGFYIPDNLVRSILLVFRISVVLFVIQEIVRLFIARDLRIYARSRVPELILAAVLTIDLFLPSSFVNQINKSLFHTSYEQFYFVYVVTLQFVVIASIAVKALRYNDYLTRIKLHPSAIFALSFALIITIGALLLLLPKSVNPGHSLSVVDAFFTSTSAVCVTGLASVDTPTTYSFLGRLIIMGLIQIGGLGVMTITTFFAVLVQGQMSIGFRVMMREFLSSDGIAGIKSILRKIAILTISIEIFGAVVIYFSLGGSVLSINPDLLFSAFFHSVSAFCNAGFSLYSDNLMSQTIQTGYVFPTMVMILIVLGGLGFYTLSNILILRSRKKAMKPLRGQLSPNTKLVLTTSLLLIFVGMVLVAIIEPFGNIDLANRLFHSLFLSVTSRTAGFNTVATEALNNATTMIIIILMWIGASPGSTGGGIKTTTFAVAASAFFNILKGREKVEMFQRHVPNSDVRKSFMIIFASLIVLSFGCILLMILEPNKNALDLIFEATSALGTVGLSRNLTYFIGSGAKLVLIILMFIGRIGSLSFFISFFSHQEEARYTLPQAKLLIG